MSGQQVLETFSGFGPPSRSLSYLIRPTFIAAPGNVLIWGDWSAIEARILPWLADSDGGRDVLKIFEANDADSTLPDIYEIEAATVYRVAAREVTYQQRQIGKVEVLALGFGGATGALQNMATNYGIYIADQQARDLVHGWRERNQWAVDFWWEIWRAVKKAVANPGDICQAGRVAYVFDRTYLGGTLFCALPCGRLLTYPSCKWKEMEIEDQKTKEVRTETRLTYRRAYGRLALWHGKFVENITQGFAGSLLRSVLVDLDKDAWVVGHTHDEVIGEVPIADKGSAIDRLHSAMVAERLFAVGLPLAAEVTSNWYYTKARG